MEPIGWNYDTASGQGAPWHRGATKRDTFTFGMTGATEANGWTPRRDFTGCEARMEVRTKAGGTLMLSLSEEASEDGQITIDGPAGTITFWISKVGTVKLVGKKASYDIFLEWPSGLDVDKVVMGEIEIDPNVTEPTYD